MDIDDDSCRRSLAESLEDSLSRPRRKYASGYDTGAGKCSNERLVLNEWMESKYRGEQVAEDLKQLIDGRDPPDFTFIDKRTKGLVGVELVELVDQDTVATRQRGNGFVYDYEWSVEPLKVKIIDILDRKERKLKEKHGDDISKFDCMILLIHTDEPLISIDMIECLSGCSCFKSQVFKEINIIMPPAPSSKPSGDTPESQDPYSDKNVDQLVVMKCQ